MAITTQTKQNIVQKYRRNELDTGSPEVQVALLTERINRLTQHFEKAKKDEHSRQGMFRLISQRRSLLNYLRKTKPENYSKLISSLNLRK
jgi:small subunit ribosomal protein S15